jgi:hypothetical protein
MRALMQAKQIYKIGIINHSKMYEFFMAIIKKTVKHILYVCTTQYQ